MQFLLERFRDYGPVAVSSIASIALWPLSRWVLPKIRSRTIHTWSHIVLGLLLACLCFRNEVVIPIGITIITYFTIDLPPVPGCAVALALNTATNIYQKLKDPDEAWAFDITCIVMMQFQRIVCTTLNLADGRKINSGHEPKRDFMKRLALKQKPPFLEWLAYNFTPLGASSGPLFEFKLFELALEVGNREHIKADSRSRGLAIRRWLTAIFWDIFNFLFMKYGEISFYRAPFYVNRPWYIRAVMSIGCTILQSCRYFSAWHPVEAAIYELGLGENDTIEDFKDISNGTLGDLFCAKSCNEWLRSWNYSAHIFWKRYLFYPLKDSGVPYSIAHHATFCSSAIWHGFHAVYYLCLPEMLGSTIADEILLKNFPLSEMSVFGRVLYLLWEQTVMFTAVCSWWYHTAEAFLFVRKTHYFSGSIAVAALFVPMLLYSALIKTKRKRAEQKKVE
jgi:hypothetical protein